MDNFQSLGLIWKANYVIVFLETGAQKCMCMDKQNAALKILKLVARKVYEISPKLYGLEAEHPSLGIIFDLFAEGRDISA